MFIKTICQWIWPRRSSTWRARSNNGGSSSEMLNIVIIKFFSWNQYFQLKPSNKNLLIILQNRLFATNVEVIEQIYAKILTIQDSFPGSLNLNVTIFKHFQLLLVLKLFNIVRVLVYKIIDFFTKILISRIFLFHIFFWQFYGIWCNDNIWI